MGATDPHVVAVIQARMGSTRLPGKVLELLAGRPVLWHIVHRLRKCKSVNKIVIATSSGAIDDPIAIFAAQENVAIVRGPEQDVLERFVLAVREENPDAIVRITGDVPLVDPATVDRLVTTLIVEQVDYCIEGPEPVSINEGIDPLSGRAFWKLVQQAGHDPIAREHITGYFKQHPNFVHIRYVPVLPEYHFEGARISVDTPSDLEFLETIYRELGARVGDADIRDVVALLRSQPSLLAINAQVKQKSLDEPNRRVILRCDGDANLGLGHVYRCLALGREFRDHRGWGVAFAMTTGQIGIDLVQRAGFPVHLLSATDEGHDLGGLLEQFLPDALILDVRTNLDRTCLDAWRHAGILIVTIDDSSDRRLAADLAFYPPVPQVQRLDWAGFTGQLFVGWDWVVLRPEFAAARKKRWYDGVDGRPLTILVTMGGSDPAGLTLKALTALDQLAGNFETVVVLGPGFMHETDLAGWLVEARRHYDLRRDVRDMVGLMAEADLAVASFGVTAYELAAMGVPAVYLCLTDDHAESASGLVIAGAAISMGLHIHVTVDAVASAIDGLLTDSEQRMQMALCAEELIDGQGTKCISEKIRYYVQIKDAL